MEPQGNEWKNYFSGDSARLVETIFSQPEHAITWLGLGRIFPDIQKEPDIWNLVNYCNSRFGEMSLPYKIKATKDKQRVRGFVVINDNQPDDIHTIDQKVRTAIREEVLQLVDHRFDDTEWVPFQGIYFGFPQYHNHGLPVPYPLVLQRETNRESTTRIGLLTENERNIVKFMLQNNGYIDDAILNARSYGISVRHAVENIKRETDVFFPEKKQLITGIRHDRGFAFNGDVRFRNRYLRELTEDNIRDILWNRRSVEGVFRTTLLHNEKQFGLTIIDMRLSHANKPSTVSSYRKVEVTNIHPYLLVISNAHNLLRVDQPNVKGVLEIGESLAHILSTSFPHMPAHAVANVININDDVDMKNKATHLTKLHYRWRALGYIISPNSGVREGGVFSLPIIEDAIKPLVKLDFI